MPDDAGVPGFLRRLPRPSQLRRVQPAAMEFRLLPTTPARPQPVVAPARVLLLTWQARAGELRAELEPDVRIAVSSCGPTDITGNSEIAGADVVVAGPSTREEMVALRQ